MNLKRYLLVLGILGVPVFAPAQPFNPKPVRALGAPRLIATQTNPAALDSVNPNYVEGKELFNPTGVALDNSMSPPAVYVVDTSNNRVLGWRYSTQLANGATADVVLGQRDKFSTLNQGPGGLVTGVSAPTGIAVDKAGNVYVADSGNNRVLRFPQPFRQTADVKLPDLVLGQSSFSSATANAPGLTGTGLFLNTTGNFPPHIGIALDSAGNLFVCDPGNNRVLRYPASALSAAQPPNGLAADLVLGQSSFTSNVVIGDRAAKTGLRAPTGLAFDSAGRLYVSDALARVLIYPAALSTGITALRTLGVGSQSSSIPLGQLNAGYVSSVVIAAGHPILVDAPNNRLLVYDTFDNLPAEVVSGLSPPASAVVGQNDFTQFNVNRGLAQPSNSGFFYPFDAAASSTELWVADTNNNRVLVFPLTQTGPLQTASRVLGQVNFTLNTANLIEGREFWLATGTQTGSVIVDRTSTPPHLYVADTVNNRILGFNDALHVKAGDIADLVIGQPDFIHAVGNYPSNDTDKPTQNTLYHPTALALDTSGNLFVADTGNSRVLRFPQPFAQSSRALLNADLVIGQSSFTTIVTDPTSSTMKAPSGVAVTNDGSLLVSDSALNRVLYFPRPLSNGMSASKVIGQPDFNSPVSGSGSTVVTPSPARLNSPREIATDAQNRVYVCDAGNGRVAIFDNVAALPSAFPSPVTALTSNLSQPVGIAVGPANTSYAGQIWVADYNQNFAFRFSSFQSTVADVGVFGYHPLSAAFDSFGNLVMADSANRVLFFVPLLTLTNAADYATGPLAPGTIVSAFPAAFPTPAPIAPATANFNSLPNPLPLPTTLGGVQVLVNQQPAPLFYVSPGQINFPLPTNLPTSGSVDLQIVNAQTGQIYGLSEVALTAQSPGLFTASSYGTGPLAALNTDSTLNSSGNPLVRGQVIVIFGTGQGAVVNGPADGTVANGLTPTVARPSVLIGGVRVDDSDIQYSGLAPGLVGVWQLNVRVPPTVTAGNQISVVAYINDVGSNSSAGPFVINTTIALR